MITYKVTFKTGRGEKAGTDNSVHCTLIGEWGESRTTSVDKWLHDDLERGAVEKYDVTSDNDLGTIWFVKLEIRRFLMENYWFCNLLLVETPSGDILCFPYYRWLDNRTVLLQEGKAKTVFHEVLPIFRTHRQQELEDRQKLYRWNTQCPGSPGFIDAETENDLPMEMRFNKERKQDFNCSIHLPLADYYRRTLNDMFKQSWSSIADFSNIFERVKNPISAYVRDHWEEDWFFGYQFLNGVNPMLIQKCVNIPENFPVTDAMVKKSLGDSKLEEEIQNGNIFIVNYEMLDGIAANVIDGVQQYLEAPVCLLYLNAADDMIPIAIQLKQIPGKDNPIFLPSDPELDWLLAKMWVRSADSNVHQIVTHLLKTQLIREPFCIATLRQLPSVHPIYKLLTPHTRFTLDTNIRARKELLSESGILNKAMATGVKGQILLSHREFLAITYQSLCLPDNLEERGVKELKRYYYKDDGLQIWCAIRKFVTKIVSLYYENDQQVIDDPELQAWIKELTEVGLRDLKHYGMPTAFSTVTDLCKFLTMVIFTCSSQYAAVNNGQYDWGAWVPNSPCSMRRPPPSAKGTVTMEHIMESLPGITQSCIQMAISCHLSRSVTAMRKLGDYEEEEYFTEDAAKDIIWAFQEELKTIDHTIRERNRSLALEYCHLSPRNTENCINL
uniref:polyunsaturated fatty acid 5-lipoxygenase-like n=1 Tax=Pristiophorus japonicus TaxID=55135 RepID=UPI00398F454B